MKYTQAVTVLHAAGAHLLICKKDKSTNSWKKPASKQKCIAHANNGGLIGIVPSSLKAVIVDVDKGVDNDLDRVKAVAGRLGMPHIIHKSSRPGRFHLWYRTDEEVIRNKKWAVYNGETLMAGGELRGTNGYAVMWRPDKVLSGLKHLLSSDPVDLTKLDTNLATKKAVGTGILGDLHAELTVKEMWNLLDRIDADVEYDTWLKVGMAIYSQWPDKSGLDIWDQWSQRGSSYTDKGDYSPAAKWRSFAGVNEVTVGTLVHLAKVSNTTPPPSPTSFVTQIHQGKITLPKSYKHITVGNVVQIYKTVKDEAGNWVDILCSPWDIYPTSHGYDEALGYETARFKWERPHKGWTDLVLRSALLNQGNKEFATAITDQTGTVLDTDESMRFKSMLKKFLEELQSIKSPTPRYSCMGWKDEGEVFVLGNSQLKRSSGGKVTEETSSFGQTVNADRLRAYAPRGTRAVWDVLSTTIDKAPLPIHGFVLGVALSAPLYKFAGLKGVVLSLYGQTGAGKTLAQYWAQSIWGNPQELHIRANHTVNALYARMGFSSNLPVTIDEVTMMVDKEVGNFCFNVSQGSDKLRLTQYAEERPANKWSLPVVVSTNKSLQSKLTASGTETDAQLARLFEMVMPVENLLSQSSNLGQAIYQTLSGNYGHLGRDFIQRLMRFDNDTLVKLIEGSYTLVQKKYKVEFSGPERYWQQLFALTYLSLRLAKDWGLLSFNIDPCMIAGLSQLANNRHAAEDVKQTPDEVLAEYLAEHARLSVVVYENSKTGAYVMDENRKPVDTIRIRYDIHIDKNGVASRGLVTVDRTHFREWVTVAGHDYASFSKSLYAMGVLVSKANERATLSKNTPFKIPQKRVVKLKLGHPSLNSILRDFNQ